jgi:hypothetical protein
MKARVLVRHRGVPPILVALAVSVLVGHICALPAAAEWEVVGAVDGHTPADSHDSDGSHVASCDATVVKAAPTCPPATDAPCVTLSAVTDVDRPTRAHDGALETHSPLRRAPDRSLFLLHASFLI